MNPGLSVSGLKNNEATNTVWYFFFYKIANREVCRCEELFYFQVVPETGASYKLCHY